MPVDQQNGVITGYTITYQSQTENNNGINTTEGNDRQKNIMGLKEYVNYNITVFASTVKGGGPPSSPVLVVRTDQDSKYFFRDRFSCCDIYFKWTLSICQVLLSPEDKACFSYDFLLESGQFILHFGVKELSIFNHCSSPIKWKWDICGFHEFRLTICRSWRPFLKASTDFAGRKGIILIPFKITGCCFFFVQLSLYRWPCIPRASS